MDEKKVKFIPFNAINEFMIDSYRNKVLQTAFTGINSIPASLKSNLLGTVKRSVNVPGFRNSAQAPARIIATHSAKAFERIPEFTGQVLTAWALLHQELAVRVHQVLTGMGWELLPIDADRTRLPGFLTRWPDQANYDTLGEAYKAQFPENQEDENDLRLMAVWLSGRLPIENAPENDKE